MFVFISETYRTELGGIPSIDLARSSNVTGVGEQSLEFRE